MKYVTGYFCHAQSHNLLVLQQVTRKRGKLPIVFAFVGREEGDIDAREMSEWFYEKVLSCCARRGPASCVDVVQELFCAKVQNKKGEFAALFAVDSECFYAWKGDVEILLLNNLFNRFHRKKLTRLSDELCTERVQVEPGVALLLGNKELGFQEFPAMDFFQNNGQADRYLRELAEISVGKEAYDKAGILIVSQAKNLRGRR